ncbi:MAG TPA: hypothetical protein VFO25_07360 [Candidatus Eremiobacteraceae bacterium]|nr:hypothetical protein [Candidatus Eremiobacteraceae bacterium]
MLPRHEHSARLPVAAIETPAVSVAAILAVVAPPVLAIPVIAAVAVRTFDAVVPLVAFRPLDALGALALDAIGPLALYPLDAILAVSAILALLAVVDALHALSGFAGFAAISLIVGTFGLRVTRLSIVERRRRFCAPIALRRLVGIIRDGADARAADRPSRSSGALWPGRIFEIVVFLHCDLL